MAITSIYSCHDYSSLDKPRSVFSGRLLFPKDSFFSLYYCWFNSKMLYSIFGLIIDYSLSHLADGGFCLITFWKFSEHAGYEDNPQVRQVEDQEDVFNNFFLEIFFFYNKEIL